MVVPFVEIFFYRNSLYFLFTELGWVDVYLNCRDAAAVFVYATYEKEDDLL